MSKQLKKVQKVEQDHEEETAGETELEQLPAKPSKPNNTVMDRRILVISNAPQELFDHIRDTAKEQDRQISAQVLRMLKFAYKHPDYKK